jgi:hypothetical protein
VTSFSGCGYRAARRWTRCCWRAQRAARRSVLGIVECLDAFQDPLSRFFQTGFFRKNEGSVARIRTSRTALDVMGSNAHDLRAFSEALLSVFDAIGLQQQHDQIAQQFSPSVSILEPT